MSFERLIQLITPPAVPDDPFSGPWEPIDDFVETTLPEDYKSIAEIYGSGVFLGFISLRIPDSVLVTAFDEELRYAKWRIFGADGPNNHQYRVWPDPDGLILFGSTDVGHYLFWNPKGPSANWSIVVLEARSDLYEEFDCSLSEFLVGVASGTIQPESFPEGLNETDRVFQTHRQLGAGEESPSDR